MKKIISLLFCLGITLGLVACSSSNDEPKEEKSSIELSKEEIESELSDICNWLIGDYWNDAMCDIVWYINNGTSSTGEEMDPEITLKRYKKAYSKSEKYNNFISSLNDDYTDIKDAWDKTYTQMKKLDEYVQKNGLNANADAEFNADLFTQSRDYFTDCVYELDE